MLLVLVPHSAGGQRIGRELMGGFGMEVGARLRYPPTRAALLATMAARAGRSVALWDESVQGPAPLEDPAGRPWECVLAHLALPAWRLDAERARRAASGGGALVLWGSLLRERPQAVLAEVPGALALVDEEEAAWEGWCAGEGAEGELLPGFARHGERGLERGAAVAPVADLGRLPIVDRTLLQNRAYRLPDAPGPVATMAASRGCPLNCAFCGYVRMEGRRLRWRPLEHLLEEWRALPGHGIERVVFRDPLFSADRKRTLALVRALEELGTGIRWQCETAPRHLDEELIAAMARAGCEHISLGIETASPRLQREFCSNKLPDPSLAARVIAGMRAHGVASRAFFMMGFPGETRAEMRASAALARELAPDSVQFCSVTPYPGTPIAAGAPETVEQGWDARRAVGGNGVLAAGEIDAEIRRAYLRFYLRPRVLLGELRRPARLLGRLGRAWSLLRR